MIRNTAGQKLTVYCYDSTTNLPATGAAGTLTAYVEKDYGALTVLADTTATEKHSTNAKGFYSFDLAQGEIDAYRLFFSAKSSNPDLVAIALPAVVNTIYQHEEDFWSGVGYGPLLAATAISVVTSQTEVTLPLAGADGQYLNCTLVIYEPENDDSNQKCVRTIVNQTSSGDDDVDVVLDSAPSFDIEEGCRVDLLPPGIGASDADHIDTLLARLTAARAALIDKMNVSGNLASANELARVTAKLPSATYLAGTNNSDGSIDFEDLGSVSEAFESAVASVLGNSTIQLGPDTLDAIRDHLLGGKLHIDTAVNGAIIPITSSSFAGGSGLSSTESFYSDARCNVVFTSGLLQGTCNPVIAYSAEDKTLFFDPPWPFAPADGDTFVFVGRID